MATASVMNELRISLVNVNRSAVLKKLLMENFSFCTVWMPIFYRFISLLSKVLGVLRVPKYPSVWVFDGPNTEVPRVSEYLKCPSVQVPWYLECPSARVLFECLIAWVPKCPSALRVPECILCPSAVGVSLECPWRALSVKKVCTITENVVINSFLEFLKNFSEYVFYITLIVFYFLGNKMCEFYQLLPVQYNHSKGVSKTSLKYFMKFQKTKYDGLQSSLLSKIVFDLLLQL